MARAAKHIVSTRNKRMASLMFHASLQQFFSILYWNSTEDTNSDRREIASADEGKMSAS
jgi:hypothetical protein